MILNNVRVALDEFPTRNLVTHQVPFSCKGSWFSFFRKNPGLAGGNASAPLSMRILTGILWENAEVFDLELERNGVPLVWGEHLRTELLTLTPVDGEGRARIAFQDAEHARLRAEGVTLALRMRRSTPSRLGANGWRVQAGSQSWLLLTTVAGGMKMEKDGDQWTLRLDGENQAAELIVQRVTSGGTLPLAVDDFDDCVAARHAELAAWRGMFPETSAEFAALRERELDTLWNMTVIPLGNFRREVTLASKGTLVGFWSWDHCWHMLGLALGGSALAKLAWNNFLAVFDHQDVSGGLPDVYCANQVCWGHVKPPIHGWMLGLLEERAAWFSDSTVGRFTGRWSDSPSSGSANATKTTTAYLTISMEPTAVGTTTRFSTPAARWNCLIFQPG